MNKFLKDLLSIILSKFGSIAFELGRVVIIARWLGLENNGLIAGLTVYPILFMTVGSLGIRQATTYYVGKGVFTIERIKVGVVQTWFLSTIISLISCYLLITKFSNSGDNIYYVILAIIPIPFTLFNVYNSGIFLGANNIRSFTRVDWLPSLFMFTTTALLVVVFKTGIIGCLIASIISPLAMAVILFKTNSFAKSFSFVLDKVVLKALVSMGGIFALSNLIINLNYKAGIIILDKISNEHELGIFSRGASLIEYLWQIPMLFSSIIFSRSANSKDDKAFSLKVIKLLRISFVAISICSITLSVCSEYIIRILFGSAFAECSSILKIMAPGVVMLTIFKVLWVDLAGRGDVWDAMKAMIPALILNVSLNFIFVPMYGATASAISSSISYSLSALIFVFIYSKRTGISVADITRFSLSDFVPIISAIKYIKQRFVLPSFIK